ncbi:DUF4153 domain-containing protein, partial [Deinococcus pimensis]|uniref:DUF4153 domain-containing protein n=1 Tax=Deinococcus pimensis TaxID=309888 RepID=UPI0012F7D15C
FELVTVAALVLPLLLGAHALLPARARSGVMFRGLSLVVVALVAVMLVSAVRRMLLYVSAYGLTEDRLLTVAVMTWVGLTLAWFVVTIWTGLYHRFAFAALLAGFAVALALNVL